MKLETLLPTLKKIAKAVGIFLAVVLLAMVSIPYLFKDSINKKVKSVINENLQGGIDYADMDLSFFQQFPVLTATIHQVDLKGSAPFQQESLIKAERFSMGIDLLSLFAEQIRIDGIYLEKAQIKVQVAENGDANYNIYKGSESKDTDKQEDVPSSGIAIKRIRVIDSEFSYADASIPMEISTTGFNYDGKGDLTKAVFDLKTHADIASLSLKYAGETYVDQKEVHAQLITQVNTDNLSFVFERNDLKINKLPISFNGAFSFLSNGYLIDLQLKSEKSTFANLLSLVPKSYNHWLEKTDLKGDVALFLNLKGKYSVEENLKPDFNFGLQIDKGLMAYNKTTVPLTDLALDFKIDMPALNFDSLKIDLNKMAFKLGSGYFNTTTHIGGFNPFVIQSTTDSHLLLDDLQQAVGWDGLTAKGDFILKALVEGTYETEDLKAAVTPTKKAPKILSIPTFQIESSLKGGYFKLDQMPKAIDLAEYELTAVSKDNQVNNIDTKIEHIQVKALSNYLNGYIHLKGLTSLDVDANAQAKVDLGDIKDIYPLEDMEIRGNLFAELISKGKLDLKHKKVPVINTTLKMSDGYLKVAASPVPLTNIKVETFIKSERGSMRDLSVRILPISFELNKQPFYLNADLKNFENIRYAVASKGVVELAPLYKIFAIDGVNVNGRVKTDFQLAGLQSDAVGGRYNRLKNKGSIAIGNIQVKHSSFPKPFIISQGNFLFNNEKLDFLDFKARYGKNRFTAKGALDNIIAYLTTDQTVKGTFEVHSDALNIADFMAFANSSPAVTATSSQAASGVVMLPKNVDLTLKSKVQRMLYDNMLIKNFSGMVQLNKGRLSMDSTGFHLAGMDVLMSGVYKPIHAKKAYFNYDVKADKFDIQKAYHEIPLFKEMVSSAKSAYGLVSLDYKLGGLLDKNMDPIMASLEGNGTLTLEDIKFKGFKLLNVIAKEADRDQLINPSVNKVVVRSSVKNNMMTLERTKMKMAGFRPRFEGKVSLNGKMDLAMRLGLPPWGILGIPFSVKGTQEKPIIKMKRNQLEEELEEEMDADDRVLYLKEKEEQAKLSTQSSS